MTRRLLAATLALGLVAAGCSDDGGREAGPTTTTTVAESATTTTTTSTTTTTTTTTTVPPVVVNATRVFVDDGRATPATGDQPELPDRTLDVWVDALDTDDVRPLVIFAHGLTGHPRSHLLLREHLADAGFVVASPAFPVTNQDSGFANAGDIEGQVGDVSFVIDSMLEDPDFGPLIDPERIGVIGHSLGGLTTAGAALSEDGDHRIGAAVVMSAGFGQVRDDVAVMVVHGDSDRIVPIASSTASWAFAPANRRMFVTLVGGNHVLGILDDETDYGPIVRGLAAGFFAQELAHDPAGAVAEALAIGGDLVTIEAGTPDGSLDDWADYFAR